MPRFVIKDVPKDLYRKLKQQAARHRRSMTEEALALLEQGLGGGETQVKAAAPFKGRFALTDRFLDWAKREGRQ